MLTPLVYAASSLTCLACAWLLLRSLKRGGHRLLLWSALCFIGLALNNSLAVLDINTPMEIIDLSMFRLGISVVSVGILLYGLIWESV